MDLTTKDDLDHTHFFLPRKNEKRSRFNEKRYRFNEKRSRYNELIIS